MCRNPFVKGGNAFGCGRCLPCLVNKRRIWTSRLLLEADCHKSNAFVTLTYDDEYLPVGGTLVPEHMQGFLKRLRWRLAPEKVRFYGVGEYGKRSDRPHYHLALFGFSPCVYGDSRMAPVGNCVCVSCKLVRDCWAFGYIGLGTLERKSAQYMCKYVTKNMRRRDDVRLYGREPEFSRMSLRPGIGAFGMHDYANAIRSYGLGERCKSVSVIRRGRDLMPLGRYLCGKLRRELGVSDEETRSWYEESVRDLRAAAERYASDKGCSFDYAYRKVVTEVDAERVRQLEARMKIRGVK